ncbi:MAG: DUF5611 family protein [Candidatus Thermoplasmatota archaeon]|nr:DUF5611 family protein [Candidatus Thermoplasmatota archaeon]MBS3789340.1 DUF5611 family protein [Candidatus Thermoplasmatota archaeon]
MGKNRYDVKRGHFENIEGDKLKKLMKQKFGEVKEKEDKLIVENQGAISNLEVWTEGRTGLWVDLEMDQDVDGDVAAETVSIWNDFLREATGFTAKKRKKRAKKKAKEK